ncbi:hypothetical protein [Paracidovorax citrulli]
MEVATQPSATLDPVTRYLSGEGIEVRKAFIGDTGIELGNAVQLGPLRLVYRYERPVLLLCEIAAVPGVGTGAAAIRMLANWVRGLPAKVPEVAAVAGLVHVGSGAAADLDESAALDGGRLVSVYRRLGARCTELGREWVQVHLPLSASPAPGASCRPPSAGRVEPAA